MKKVLLSSLVAVMAVTSANAKIASTNYADQAAGAALSSAQAYTDRKTGDVSSLATDADLKVVKGVSDLTAAVKKLDEAVNAASGDLGKLGALATLNTVGTGQIDNNAVTADKLAADSVTTAKIANANVTADKLAANSVITAKIADAAVTEAKLDTTLAKKINDTSTLSLANKQAIDVMTSGETGILNQAKKYTDEEVGKKQDIITDLETIRAGAAKGATAVQNFSSLSGNAEVVGANDGMYVTSVAQSNGKITPSVVAFSRTVTESDTNAPQAAAVKSYVDTATGSMAFDGPGFQIANEATNLTEALSAIDGVAAGNQERVNQVLNSPVMSSGITQAKVAIYDSYADGKQDALTTKQLAAVDSGIDAAKVAQIATNTGGIAANKASIEGITNAKDAEDGNYVLTKKVVNNVATYAWELIDRDLAN